MVPQTTSLRLITSPISASVSTRSLARAAFGGLIRRQTFASTRSRSRHHPRKCDRYQEAIDLLTPLIAGGLRQRLSINSRRSAPLQEAILNTLGTALWALGDLDGAEAAYKRATREHPSSAGAYSYWARLLRERGDEQAAVEKEKIARVNALTFENYPEIASLYFWMSPRHNQPLVRRIDVPALTR